MSYMDRENILLEGIIDKLVKLLTKSTKSAKEKEEEKAYKDALASVRATSKKLDAALKKAGVDPKQFEV